MTNASIYAAFERMWQHTTNLVGKQIADVKTAIDTSVNYYDALSTAITDINNGVTTHAIADVSAAKVKVFPADNGRITVMLLDNISESALIDITKDIDLILNGKTLSFTTSGAYLNFNSNGNCSINGEVDGSAIEKIVSGNTSAMYAINARGVLKIRGGRYHVESNTGTTNLCIRVDSASEELVIDGCTVSIKNTYGTSGSFYARAIQNQGKNTVIKNSEILSFSMAASAVCVLSTAVLHMENTTAKADAMDCHSGGNVAIALELREGNSCYLTNCNVYGTHSGIQSTGNLYVNGGTYTGYCHGGIYFNHASGNAAYVNDAVFRAGNYDGEFDYSGKTADIYGAFYVGGTNDAVVYMDNCTIDGADCTQGAFVIRSTSGETNNTVNVSNSNVENGTVRIDPNSGHRVNIGIGCNFNAANVNNPAYAEMTDELYRKNHADKDLDGNDYNAIVGIFANSSLPSVTTDNNGSFLRVVNGAWNISSIPNAEEAEF